MSHFALEPASHLCYSLKGNKLWHEREEDSVLYMAALAYHIM